MVEGERISDFKSQSKESGLYIVGCFMKFSLRNYIQIGMEIGMSEN